MSLTFEPITLNKQPSYLALLHACPQVSSDYSFINLWAWAEAFDLSWAWEDDLVWIRQAQPYIAHWAPVGAWQRIDWAERLSRHRQVLKNFSRLPEQLIRYWQTLPAAGLQFETARGQWDYLYEIKQLVDLRGNRFHKKKNLLNQFVKQHDYAYTPLGPSMIAEVLDMQTTWCTWRDCESSEMLSAENRAITRVLSDWHRLQGLTGGALSVSGKTIAYTIAENLNDEMLLIHFEKASPEFKGSYQAVNQIFLAQTTTGQSIVNREQDLDDPGLRRAKLSYHPAGFIRKYTAVIKEPTGEL